MSLENGVALQQRRFLVPEMEGGVARWYDRQRGTESQLATYRKQAAQLTAHLPEGATILEVAPGPGHHAIEMARRGRFHVTGLDISHTMVEIARDKAAIAGVAVDFQRGDVTAMPFADGAFDLIVCHAAFKNFRQPVRALDEMHRVLRPGGRAVIQDLSQDATPADIAREVDGMNLGTLNGAVTKFILSWLRRRALPPAQFERLIAESRFRKGELVADGVSLEVRLTRPM